MFTWHWLSRQVFFFMVFNTSNQMLQWYLKSHATTTSFLTLFNSLFTTDTIIGCFYHNFNYWKCWWLGEGGQSSSFIYQTMHRLYEIELIIVISTLHNSYYKPDMLLQFLDLMPSIVILQFFPYMKQLLFQSCLGFPQQAKVQAENTVAWCYYNHTSYNGIILQYCQQLLTSLSHIVVITYLQHIYFIWAYFHTLPTKFKLLN